MLIIQLLIRQLCFTTRQPSITIPRHTDHGPPSLFLQPRRGGGLLMNWPWNRCSLSDLGWRGLLPVWSLLAGPSFGFAFPPDPSSEKKAETSFPLSQCLLNWTDKNDWKHYVPSVVLRTWSIYVLNCPSRNVQISISSASVKRRAVCPLNNAGHHFHHPAGSSVNSAICKDFSKLVWMPMRIFIF